MTKKKNIMRSSNDNDLFDVKEECIEVKEEKDNKKEMKNEKRMSTKNKNDYDKDEENEETEGETKMIDTKNLKVEIGHKNVPENSVSTTNSPRALQEGLWDNHVNSTALQIIDVIGEGEGESCMWAIQLVRETLHSAREGDQLLVI